MRSAALIVLGLLLAGASGQTRPGGGALEDALTLANLRPADLDGVPPPTGAQAAHVAALRDPLAGIVDATVRHREATGDDTTLLRKALGLLGVAPERGPSGEVAELPANVPPGLRAPVGRLVAAIAKANDETRAALATLKPAERRLLIEALPRLAAEDPSLPVDFAHGPPDLGTARRLLDSVDTPRIMAAGFALATEVRRTLPALQASRGSTPTLLFRCRGVLVEIAGSGRDQHGRRDVGLCLDLGGDDRYSGRYGAGVGYASVLIDLGGNDRYLGPDGNYGSGILGIGLAYDLAGDDVYGVRTAGLGAGLAGVGVLSDAAGDDRYRVVGVGLGAGLRGIGLVADRLGDDAYDAGRAGQGYGAMAGVGWIVDGAGHDAYRGGDWVQAMGRKAGFGLLTDGGGDDVYRAAWGQAASQGGYASLGDAGGDDTYVATRRGQGFAEQGGFAALIDEAGDDAYLLKRGLGQAAAFGAVAVLADATGNDVYGGTEGSPATAYADGVAILSDGEGDDRYLSSGAFQKEAEGVALWVDGGGRDRYGSGRSDAQADVGATVAALDAFGSPDAALPAPMLPAPGSLPLPSSAELADLRNRAANGPDPSGAVARLVGIGVPALEALATDPDETFVAVATRMGAAAAATVARMAASDDPRAARAALATAGFVPLPSEAVVAAFDRPGLLGAAASAAGRGKVQAAVPSLVRATASADPAVVRSAIQALSAIGASSAVGTASALVDHPDVAVRRAAFRMLVTQPAVATATATRLVAAPDGFRQRIGLALLGAVGTPSALALIGPSLQGGRDAKIGALLALDGKVPASLIAAVEALRRDPDPLVRAVAERTDVGP